MSVKEVVDATRGRLLSGPYDVTFPRLFTDSREVKPGGLFVALRGEQHDGHVFIPQAIERGAAGILCERPPQGIDGVAVIQVDDTRQALFDITTDRLARQPHPLVAITRNARKTPTQKPIAHLPWRPLPGDQSGGHL